MFLICINIALMSTVIGYVYSAVLIQPGEALHWLYKFFQKHLTKKEIIKGAEVPEELRSLGYNTAKTYEKVTEHWLLKPLGACEKCTAGQIAMWFFLHQSIAGNFYNYYNSTFVLIHHLFTICLTILLTKLLQERL